MKDYKVMGKRIVVFICCILAIHVAQAQEQRTLSGKVSDGKAPMENVTVTVLNTNTATITDKDGFYRIPVATGDELQFSYMGMKTVRILVEDVTRILNPIMIPDVKELDEVVVTQSRRKSQKDLEADYNEDPKIIRTAFGYLHADAAPGRLQIMKREDLSIAALCILELVNGRWPAVTVFGDCFKGGGVTVRGNTAIYDIDGLIVQDAPLWLDVNSIDRITILGNLSLTTSYGSIGQGAVVVINTNSGNRTSKGFVDKAKLRNNFYKDDALDSEAIKKNWPTYKKELYASESFEAAQAKFKELANTHSNSPYFFLDSQAYFTKEWDRVDIGEDIITNHFTPYAENPVLLKALAYQYQEQGQNKKANDVYKEIFLLRPNYAQSYLDMAKSYREMGSPEKSASLHLRYNYLQQQGFMELDTTGFGPIMDREFNNLLALEKDAVLESGKRNKLFIAQEDFDGTRLVFEWNDGEAEFELQFVNPEKQYHIWKHSLADNAESIAREKAFGYNVMEELIDGSLPGTWQVNVNYLGNKSLTPTYLKATVYYNYGKISQRKEIKVFKLNLKNVNQELFKVQSVSGLVSK
ncbi:carboxypeptidase-like regulatory domain-containing protein [Maribacter chungangensis]|uniref:Carboxypeptidase-like regulatory domain-containing protein n=1 Tax=Maribacter chungangensis TaxID=1069117 RepID=A0ABW3B253_9FLAO